ncbi:nicotinate phosphoribosyltransferase [Candidatus Nitronereus thalassa]|uniref:Nicotinate phosphoribosyltransferase n=1 Tax=Candidatus Nitronereus thalassa TaxID=3020898 RepID=A0ABU3KC40_9BACT|nr:nicotinate phosphoribosyltransferase [Candidatus Nitronereus thalassa]MDT7044080.1 nicotinate phosphoribosyltransferase [Candidatus Nitronereus thalassa]
MSFPDIRSSILLTDLYQLTMLQGYMEQGMEETAVFEFFSRKMPPQRGFYMAAGLEQLVEFLEQARFTPEELEWVEKSGYFSKSFVKYLERWRFTGDLHAMPEGTIFFANEPIARITAPLPEAQLVETRLINLLQYQTLAASKAARCVLAASGKPLIDFGLRRAHGAEAGLLAARASYLAGFAGSATVLAELLFGVPVFGTMAHSFIQAHTVESEAFEHFAEAQPENVILLIDTYDTEEGAKKIVALAPRLKDKGIAIKGVRLDSGDLVDHAFKVRKILDEGGLSDVQITASGNLDEYAIQAMVADQAPIDFLAVGTKMTASADVPYLDCAYKLQEYAGRACRKKSEGKATWPGRKQVYRHYDSQGHIDHDVLTTADDSQDGELIIEKILECGKRISSPIPLPQSREHAAAQLQRLPEKLRLLREGTTVDVQVSQALRDLAQAVDAQR